MLSNSRVANFPITILLPLVLVLIFWLKPVVASDKPHRLYAGGLSSHIGVKGYKDAYFNDSHRPVNLTTYSLVNFSSANRQTRAYGVFAGYQFYLTEDHGPNVQIGYVQRGKLSSATILFGYVWPLTNWHGLQFSVIPQVGYASLTIDFGELDTNNGVHIELGADKFDSGDEVTSVSRGIAFAALGEMRYKLLQGREDFELFLQFGYQVVLLNSPVVYVDGIEVTDREAFDEPGGSGDKPYNEDSNYSPSNSVESNLDGLVASLGFSFRF